MWAFNFFNISGQVYYDPEISRFLNVDPIKDGSNWYGYTGGNPVRYTDPSGLKKADVRSMDVSKVVEGYKKKEKLEKGKVNAISSAAPTIESILKSFSKFDYEPGMLSGKNVNIGKLLDGTAASNSKLVAVITADANAAGYDFLPLNKEDPSDGYILALVVNPDKWSPDYHWYRQNKDGAWSHKPGMTPVTTKVLMGVDEGGNYIYGKNDITNPQEAADATGYTVFIGYYRLVQK